MLRRSFQRQHVPTKCEAGSQNRCKHLANTRLDLRNAANSLQIEGNGVLHGDPRHWGRHVTQDHIYTFSLLYRFICPPRIINQQPTNNNSWVIIEGNIIFPFILYSPSLQYLTNELIMLGH